MADKNKRLKIVLLKASNALAKFSKTGFKTVLKQVIENSTFLRKVDFTSIKKGFRLTKKAAGTKLKKSSLRSQRSQRVNKFTPLGQRLSNRK